MKRILKILLWILLAAAGFIVLVAALNWDLVQCAALGGLKFSETPLPSLPAEIDRPSILVFSKSNGYRHEEAILAANALFSKMAKDKGWGYYLTENGAAFSPAILARFDAVFFNNVSGDVFLPSQRAALKAFLENGGGFVGIHGARGDMAYDWKWYVDELIGAQFVGHRMSPQFQQARLDVEDKAHPVTQGLPASWQGTEEWYSFEKSARASGARVLVTVDEKTHKPEGFLWASLDMGDHPMVWSRCIGKGRMFYSAFGHPAGAYSEPQNKMLLTNAIGWALKLSGSECGTSPAPIVKEGDQ